MTLDNESFMKGVIVGQKMKRWAAGRAKNQQTAQTPAPAGGENAGNDGNENENNGEG